MDTRKYTTANANESGRLDFPASMFLNILTETEMCAFFRSSTQIIADTALLMSHRDSEVDVTSTRFNDVMTACISENIFTTDRVAAFKRGIRLMRPEEQ
tara:strand:- start:266 stop:562 length:297 start_codon:yes stop_codon:yes gene_type:complete